MAEITDFLTRDHRDLDELYAAAEKAVAGGDWPLAEKKARRFRESLERHFAMEESVLFPALESATGMSGGPPEIMRREHAQMRRLLDALDAALQGRDATTWLANGDALVVMNQQHDMKEEGILYPMADDVLGHEAGDVVARMMAERDRA